MDRSTAGDVIAFEGHPDADLSRLRGDEFEPPFRGLGYDCSVKPRGPSFPVLAGLGGQRDRYCTTVYWLNLKTDRLGDFSTASSRYVESHGVRVGMPTRRAEHLLQRRVDSGCSDVIFLGRPHGGMTVEFGGGKQRHVADSTALTISGGHVLAFALHSRQNDLPVVFDCL